MVSTCLARSEQENPLAPRQPPLPARAKHVIYLHMAGLAQPARPV